MLRFAIPDSYDTGPINAVLLQIMQEKKEWFYDDFQIEMAYGCPPSCIWNGSRSEFGIIAEPYDWGKGVVELYARHGIKYRLTFTNFLLRREHLYDTYGNRIAEVLDKYGGYVMVSIPLMADYMKKYPNLKVCWSTTTDYGKTPDECVEKINELSRNTIVVLPRDMNSHPEVDRLIHPENIEVLVNERCVDDCPHRMEHYKRNNLFNIMETATMPECKMRNIKYDPAYIPKHRISRAEIPLFSKRGITRYKIEGRLDKENTITAYLEYFVLPTFRMQFLDYMDKLLKSQLSGTTQIVRDTD